MWALSRSCGPERSGAFGGVVKPSSCTDASGASVASASSLRSVTGRRRRRPVTDRSELAEATEAPDASVEEDGLTTPPNAPERSGPQERDKAHIPRAAAPQ